MDPNISLQHYPDSSSSSSNQDLPTAPAAGYVPGPSGPGKRK